MRTFPRTTLSVVALLIIALLSGCPAEPARLTVSTPDAIEWVPPKTAIVWPEPDWFEGFGSPELTAFIGQALSDNLDLQGAAERVVQADARARQAHAAILPSVDALGNVNYLAGHSSYGSLHETDWSALLSASYEIDFWGKNRAQAAAASYLGAAARADKETVRLTTEAAVADTYFEIVSLRERLAAARANAESSQQLLEVVQSRYQAGYANPVEVATQSAAFASQRAAVPELEQAETRASGALAVLLGRPPEHFSIQTTSLEDLREPIVSPGLPAALLRRRPDIAQAEANVQAAHADLEVARAALFPSLTMTAAGGLANPALNAAVNSLSGVGPTVNLGAALAQSIFDGGKRRAQRLEASSREQELLITYRASILSALVDVENSLSAIARLDAARSDQEAIVAQSERAYEGARVRYQRGFGDFLGVLEAQRAVYKARDQFAQYRLARLEAAVSLCKALGGGWAPSGDSLAPGKVAENAAR
jgi:NodT family efflux transporter outer membrane factor (OMF) lipoprotein